MISVIGTSVPRQWSCHVRCMHVAVGAVGEAKGGRKLRPVSLHFHLHLLWAVFIALCFMLYATIVQITREAQNSVYNCNIRAEQTATVAQSDASVVLVCVSICICVCNFLLILCNRICACIRAEYQYFYLYVYICICVCIRGESIPCRRLHGHIFHVFVFFINMCILVFVFVCLYICSERSASAAQRSDAPVTHIQPGQAGLAPLFLFLPYCSLCTVS